MAAGCPRFRRAVLCRVAPAGQDAHAAEWAAEPGEKGQLAARVSAGRSCAGWPRQDRTRTPPNGRRNLGQKGQLIARTSNKEVLCMKFDYLIVGAGLYGAVFAQQMTAAGKRCLVIDRRPHLGGNAHCETVEGIQVHRYGAHIFHTSDQKVWDYVRSYASFNQFVNAPLANFQGKLYNLPFNMNTFTRLWDVITPAQAQEEIRRQAARHNIQEPANLEEQALKLVGDDIYQKLIKGYTEKQWGRDCKDLPTFIIQRVPLRFTFDNNYFTDRYQGIPEEGYDALVEKLLEGSQVLLSTDYESFVKNQPACAEKTVYTGTIDGFFHYRFGPLEYRSLRFETEVLDCPNFQGNAVINYTAREVPYTRIIEHKHFLFGTQPHTVITREYPASWTPGQEPYYPVNDPKNQALYQTYQELARSRRNVRFGGRLGAYRYYNMDQVIRAALDDAAEELAGSRL